MKLTLEELSKYFKGALDSASDAIGISTPEGKHWYQNKSFDNLFGDIGQDPPSSIYVDQRIGKSVFKTIMAGEEWIGDVRMKGKDGNRLDIFLHAYPIKDGNGEVTGLVGIHSDVTQQMQDKKLFQLQHDLGISLSGATNLKEALTLIVNSACRVPGMDCGGVYLVDHDSKALNLVYSKGLSPQFVENISHYEKDSTQVKMITSGKGVFANYSQLKISRDPVKQNERIEAIAIIPIFHRGKAIGALNVASHSISRIPLHIQNHLETIASQVGSAIARVIVEEVIQKQNLELQSLSNKLQQEVDEHKFTAKTLDAEKERFRILSEKSPLGISMIGSDGRYLYLNPKFIEIFGYELDDIPTGKEWFQKAFPDKEYREHAISTWLEDQRASKVGNIRPREFSTICKDHTEKLIHYRPVTTESNNQLVIYEDITEKSKMEQQLRQTQKFEAIGTLAGGIAHDFNNLLMGIQGRTSLMSVDLEPSHSHLEHLSAIEDYIQNATDLTKQLLGLARGGKYEVKPTDINELVHKSANMFGRANKELRIQTKFKIPSPVVRVDKRQIEQVLLNLYINAWQAMPDGGELYLATRVVSLDEAFTKPYNATPGNHVQVSVRDTGVGMDAATQQQIFDPFFTTKDKGRGTGLGLASAYGIIKNHEGIILVNSKIGHGTTFHIYLPMSDEEAYPDAPMAGRLLKGSETVLLVDDEEMILEVGQAMLKKLGYRIIVADSGRQALDVVDSKGDDIDMVILDLIMPGMDGGKVFERIKEIRPQLPVMLSSGYAINGQADDIMKRGCNGFIQKPFSISALSIKIRKILDDRKNQPYQSNP
jgi:PAS domain S-box-containing protein